MAEENPEPRKPPPLPPPGVAGGGVPLPPHIGGGLPPKAGGQAPFNPAELPPPFNMMLGAASQPPSTPPPSRAGGPPALPGLPPAKPPMPPMPPQAPKIPSPAAAPVAARPAPPAAPPPSFDRPRDPASDKAEYEKKLAEMEKRLQEEREKAMLATMKSQEEAITAARVEVSIKELQDKLKRDRRDQEQEESRLKLEGKVQELEARLAQERETWVTTLKGQMQGREAQDKELESHFTLRIQEMERRWLEEKAHWQKLALAKDEEIRNLRALAEKLKSVDGEYSKVSIEKKALETRVQELTQERSEVQGKLQQSFEKEKEMIQLRADLTLARGQHAMAQERLERDLQTLRVSAKDREERLLSDQERLSRDLNSVAGRLRAEHEAEVQHIKLVYEQEASRLKEAAGKSVDEALRLRGVTGALEKQLAAARVQLDGLQKAASQWDKLQERYKAEFMVLQRKWADREKEIRQEYEAQYHGQLDAEKARVKLKTQEEFDRRAALLADKLKLEQERLRQENEEIQGPLRAKIEDLTAKLAREDEAKGVIAGARLEVEKLLSQSKEEIGSLKSSLADAVSKLAAAEAAGAALKAEKDAAQRLAMAQAAESKNIQDGLMLLKNQMAQEAGMARYYLQEKESAEKAAGLVKKEFEIRERDLRAWIAELEGRLGLSGRSAPPAPPPPELR